ncbi:uncharacterized protein LMH87_007635 [Akanthomyces muscarius]|uniref:Histone chaperone RTT106/FACT complex subunit SPT16-like middle domain-containing protein n=1 Tax=Akanthomyces muscarius TaxID=2231603 RepID=A0A9W8URH5_AKAMU|nr:uncharacterized protein LMH87_007635 [Akanthomyces muscarius]KAJ4161605.1 hypothetical protein LMH87_007635 [Akanthomyces muscarius]
MALELDMVRLKAIFEPRSDILDGIKRCAETPGKIALFNEIALHVHRTIAKRGEPKAQSRKVRAGPGTNRATAGSPANDPVLLHAKEISVLRPQRKKLELCFTQSCLYARAPGTTVPIQGIVYAWTNIKFIFYLPVPEKAQVQHNYVLFPRGSTVPSESGAASSGPLVFTVPATTPKEGTIAGAAAAASNTYKGIFHSALNNCLRATGSGVKIVSSASNKSHSVVRQSNRSKEKFVHVRGFRGSQDGYLFFLENGILWGYKKPLIFFPLRRIAAIGCTKMLQITFSIIITVFTKKGAINNGYEFSMIDREDYSGIDDYIKRNGLQNKRKAKKGANDGKMKLEDLDDDDEDEEEYDPSEHDESRNGSGESSDEGDDDDDDDDDDRDDGGW